jgi:topoisomerase-4 subunit A
MAKKNKVEDQTKYRPELLEDIMGQCFGRYAKYIIQERALPDARDGLKPVQRRILYAMYHDGNTFDHAYRKSAKTVGLVIGNYHPHGDSSVYEAMVRMSQDWKVRLPLIDIHGNNGSIDDDPAAAMRYTEARLAKVTEVMESDLDKDTVEMAPNFDDTENEPTVLPVPFPVMLVNGAEGIAAGYATNMPPHNLAECVDASVYRLQNPACSLNEIMEIIPGPDFPTGGLIMGSKGIRDAFETGKGRITVRAKADIIDDRTCQQIVITEIPFGVIKKDMVKKMDEIRLSKDIDGILDVRDESDRTGMRIVIDVKKESDAKMILDYFYKNTDLQIYYSYNNVAIIDKRPVQVGLLDLLDAFLDFRKEVVLRRSKYELDKMEARCHIIEGLMKAVSILDDVIKTIRASKDKADSKNNLMKKFGFDEPQAEAIVSMRLYRLSNTDITQLRDEFALLVNNIEETKAILENPNVLNSVIVKELREVKKEYGDARRTVISEEAAEINIDKAQMVTNERVMVTVSRDGYVKRVSLRSFNSSDRLTGLKQGDVLIGAIECDTVDTLLLFTSRGNYASLPVWQIDEAKWKDIGMHLNKVIRIDGEDKIRNAVLIKDFNTYAWIVTVSSAGQIKKTPVDQWMVAKNNRVTAAMNIPANAELICAYLLYQGQQIMMVSKDGYAYRFSAEEIPATGVKSKGVKAMNLGKGDKIGYSCPLNETDGAILYVTDQGAMKRVHLDEIVTGSRPVKGNLICKHVKSNPSVLVYAKAVQSGEEIEFFDTELQEVKVSDIPLKPRETGFSNPIVLQAGWDITKGIDECRIIDKPEGVDNEVHEDVEKLSLFDSDN